MASLLHLNGPPGIGKSTLARLYADRHPGTLNLDIDLLHGLVGGWREGDGRTHDILRPLALAMAGAHLDGGRDVVLPQFLGAAQEIAAFEQVAHEHQAAFREVVLLAGRTESVARFTARIDDTEWGAYNRHIVDGLGGEAWLASMHDRLVAVIAERPSAVVVHSEAGAVETTYRLLVEALGKPGN